MAEPDFSAAAAGSPEHAKLGALVSFWAEICVMAEVRCKMCNGYGHQHRDCPTAKKLNKVAMASVTARNRHALARNELVVANAAHIRDNAQLPRGGGAGAQLAGRKRRKMAPGGAIVINN